MFRRLVIAFITAVAALLETAADAIAATLPPPTVDSPRLRVVAPGRLRPRVAELNRRFAPDAPLGGSCGDDLPVPPEQPGGRV
jgi:hypothetical protein